MNVIGRGYKNRRNASASSERGKAHISAYYQSATVSYKFNLGGGRMESTDKPINSTSSQVTSHVRIKNVYPIDIEYPIHAKGYEQCQRGSQLVARSWE